MHTSRVRNDGRRPQSYKHPKHSHTSSSSTAKHTSGSKAKIGDAMATSLPDARSKSGTFPPNPSMNSKASVAQVRAALEGAQHAKSPVRTATPTTPPAAAEPEPAEPIPAEVSDVSVHSATQDAVKEVAAAARLSTYVARYAALCCARLRCGR